MDEVQEEQLAKRPANTFTVSEYMKSTGLTKKQARTRIEKLLLAGKIKAVEVPVKMQYGTVRLYPGYQLVEHESGISK